MTDQRLRATLYRRWLRDVIYNRPGYRIGWDDENGLAVTIDTFDSDNPPEIIEQTHGFGYPPDEVTGKREFFNWIFQCLMLQTLHEVGEFFIVAGERLYHPHRDGLEKMAEAMGNIPLREFSRAAKD